MDDKTVTQTTNSIVDTLKTHMKEQTKASEEAARLDTIRIEAEKKTQKMLHDVSVQLDIIVQVLATLDETPTQIQQLLNITNQILGHVSDEPTAIYVNQDNRTAIDVDVEVINDEQSLLRKIAEIGLENKASLGALKLAKPLLNAIKDEVKKLPGTSIGFGIADFLVEWYKLKVGT